MEASGRCGRRGKCGTLPGVVGAVPLAGVGVGDRKRCHCWLLLAAVLVFSTRGGRELPCAPHARTPGCLATLHGTRVCLDTYSGQGGHGQTKTWMGTRRAGPVAAAAHSYGREKHTQGQSPRGHDGRRDTRTAGPIGLRVVATEHGGLACSRIAPACLGSLQGPTTYTASLERFRWSAALSAICVPAWSRRPPQGPWPRPAHASWRADEKSAGFPQLVPGA